MYPVSTSMVSPNFFQESCNCYEVFDTSGHHRKSYSSCVEPKLSKAAQMMSNENYQSIRDRDRDLNSNEKAVSGRELYIEYKLSRERYLQKQKLDYDNCKCKKIVNYIKLKKSMKFVKISKRILKETMGSVSPRLVKKIGNCFSDTPYFRVFQNPEWPSSSETFYRGVTKRYDEEYHVPTPRDKFRRENSLGSSGESGIESSEENESGDQIEPSLPISDDNENINDDFVGELMRFDSTETSSDCEYEDAQSILPEATLSSEEFWKEPMEHVCEDLDYLPSLDSEDLMNVSINEVKNVHVLCDYVVLETPNTDIGVFV